MAQSAVADDVFQALASPTRRKVLERLSAGPATVSDLAERRRLWEARLDRLDEYVTRLQAKESHS